MRNNKLIVELNRDNILLCWINSEPNKFEKELKHRLLQFNIHVVFMKTEEFFYLPKRHFWQILIFRTCLESAWKFTEFKKNYVDSPFNSGPLQIHDVSSFSSIENNVKSITKNSYSFYQLPIQIDELVLKLTTSFYSYKASKMDKQLKISTRSKLPSL